jgi:hypothetical protein
MKAPGASRMTTNITGRGFLVRKIDISNLFSYAHNDMREWRNWQTHQT